MPLDRRPWTWLLVVVLFAALALVHVSAMPASADGRTPVEATAHARAELANAIAQGKVTLTPTPTSTPTATRAPTPAQQPAPVDPPAPTPEPPLPVPVRGDDPVPGYLRPSLRNDGETLELALAQGRWDVRFTEPDCLDPWNDVRLLDGAVVVGVDEPWPACALAGASWRSDAPCAMTEAGVCSLMLDLSFWDMLGRTATPTYLRTPQPTATVPAPPARVSPAPQVRAAPPRAPAPEPQMVVVTATPTDTPEPTPPLEPTARPSDPPTATPTPVPTWVPAVVLATPGATAVATVATTPQQPRPQLQGHWDWALFFKLAGAVLLVAGALVLLVYRRPVAVWKGHPHA